VTTGALYHHFENKKALFEWVAEAQEAQVQQEVNRRIGRKLPSVDLLREVVEVSMDVLADPRLHRILLLDAPNVFGLDRWREVEARYGLGGLTELMAYLKSNKTLNVDSPAIAARLLLSLLIEAARMANRADNPRATRRQALHYINTSIDGMQP
jgi:AcrR family transcriptional regulator